MSFEWQDGNVPDTADTFTSFEDSTDFGQLSLHSSHQTATSNTSDSNAEAAEPSPADPDHDWVQPWSGSPADVAPIVNQDQSKSYQHSAKENQPKPKIEPMSDEHKTAILGKSPPCLCPATRLLVFDVVHNVSDVLSQGVTSANTCVCNCCCTLRDYSARTRTQTHLVGTWPTISWNACIYY